MTVPLTANRNDYTGNGSSSVFSFTFPVFVQADLQLVVTDASYNATALTIGQDYTVAGLNPAGGPPSTGTITLVNNSQVWLSSGNLATGYVLSIVRNVSVVQATSLRNQGDYFPEVIENEFDDVVMMLQRLSSFGLVLPPSINPSTFSPILPTNLLSSAGKVLMINAAGTALIVGTPTGQVIAVPLPVSQGGTGSIATLIGGKVMVSLGQTIVEATVVSVIQGGTGSIAPLTGGRLMVSSGQTIIELALGQIPGTTTNDNGATGKVGEYVAAVGTSAAPGATTVWSDLASISLTAGDWDVTAIHTTQANGATITGVQMGISATSGNVSPGTTGQDLINCPLPSVAAGQQSGIFSNYRMSLAATTTVYFKIQMTYTVATPNIAGFSLKARRVR